MLSIILTLSFIALSSLSSFTLAQDVGVQVVCGRTSGQCWKKQLDFGGGFPYFCCYWTGSVNDNCSGRMCVDDTNHY